VMQRYRCFENHRSYKINATVHVLVASHVEWPMLLVFVSTGCGKSAFEDSQLNKEEGSNNMKY
jgi:hypothetical protein